MPTVFGFILISSMFLFIQGVSCVVQVYGLKAQINNLHELNYAVNIKRVINHIENNDSCSFKEPLSYTKNSNKLSVQTNCIYMDESNQNLTDKLNNLSGEDELNADPFTIIDNYIHNASASETDGEVTVKYNGQTQKYVYDDKYYILEIKYDKSKIKLVVINEMDEIELNYNVKQM